MKPKIIQGGKHTDYRGTLSFNNGFDSSAVKRIYSIESPIDFKRGWQGHKVEQRWFNAIVGRYEIFLISIDDSHNPSPDLEVISFILDSNSLDVLHVPPGYITCLKALEENSKLLVFADYEIGETNDEMRFELDYFTNLKNQK